MATRDRKVIRGPVDPGTGMVTDDFDEPGEEDGMRDPHGRRWRICWRTWRFRR